MADEQNVEPQDLYRFELSEEQGAEIEKLTGQPAKALIVSTDELRDMSTREGRYQDSVAAGTAPAPR